MITLYDTTFIVSLSKPQPQSGSVSEIVLARLNDLSYP